MELRQLRTFIKAAETLNFSEAAKSLNMTQSAFSQNIKQLEDGIQPGVIVIEIGTIEPHGYDFIGNISEYVSRP